KNSPDIVKRLEICLHEGEFFAILGGNGTGKTTSLKVLAGLKRHYRGEIHRNGKIGFLPQNPQTLFLKKTVYEDLCEVFSGTKAKKPDIKKAVMHTAKICRIDSLLERHPYDLSGGEQQRTALAKILLCEPEILLLDEPTKGLDAEFKEVFAEILNELLSVGKAVLMVSHDIEFCAEYADRCAMFFDGEITAQGSPHEFFSENNFYTTPANRMSRHLIPEAITVSDVVSACGGEVKPKCERKKEFISRIEKSAVPKKTEKLPLWRKIIGTLSGITALAIFLYTAGITDLTKLITVDGLTELAGDQIKIYIELIVSLFIMAVSFGRRSEIPIQIQTSVNERKLSGRTISAVIMAIIAVPLTLFISIYYLDIRKYN
ncbi:MAG: ATP-binding cassette domain-containing protein, partial [Ruminococcus sp.]|nr:ATP-binding cassette domain-containing protein [Ruminococcus sp.]